MFRKSLGFRLLIPMAALLTGCAVLLAFLVARSQSNQLLEETAHHTQQLGETVIKSTRFDMLRNQQEDIAKTVENVGGQNGIEHIRIINKAGEVRYSSDRKEIGTVLEQEAEGCRQCHVSSEPLKALDPGQRWSVFQGEAGHRVLTTVGVILNEPACSTAPCHEHEEEGEILGVLGIGTSLEEVDRQVAATTRNVVLFGLGSALLVSFLVGLFIHRFVSRPVRSLVRATRRIGEGNLAFETPAEAAGEIKELAASFEEMTGKLEKSIEDLRKATDAKLKAERLAAVGETITGIAHCVKNMLNGLQAGLYVLKVDVRKQVGEVRDLSFRMIDNNVKRLSALVLDMLTYSKDREPEYERTDLNDLV
ncbi:MAG: HAMP domain-containing protein, partial [Planctomycetota bacterium]